MERVELTRECEAVQVPLGSPITLEKGLEVFITQSLGGSFTVQVPAYGGLYRITSKDADALGKNSEDAASPASASGDLEAMVWEQLKTCYDPEIPVNIVDLGLVYAMEVAPVDGGAKRIDIKMTLTAQGKVTMHTAIYPLDAALDAIHDLDGGKLRGRGILVP